MFLRRRLTWASAVGSASARRLCLVRCVMPTHPLPANCCPNPLRPHTGDPWHSLAASVAQAAPAVGVHSLLEGRVAQAEAHNQHQPADSLLLLQFRPQRQSRHLLQQLKLQESPPLQLPLLSQLQLPLFPHLQPHTIKPIGPHLLLHQPAPLPRSSSPSTLATTQSRPSHRATSRPSRTPFPLSRTPFPLFRIPIHHLRIHSRHSTILFLQRRLDLSWGSCHCFHKSAFQFQHSNLDGFFGMCT